MIFDKRLLAPASVAIALNVLVACAQGPAQHSVYVGRGYEAEGPVYSLPRGIIGIAATKKTTTITIAKPTIDFFADPEARFVAVWHEDAFAYDKFDFEVNSKGLLNSFNKVTSDDQTGKIIGKAVELVAESLKTAVKLSAPAISGDVEPAEGKRHVDSICDKDFDLSEQIDPFRIGMREFLQKQKNGNTKLLLTPSPMHQCFDITVTGVDGKLIEDVPVSLIREIASECDSSVCLRLPVPVIVTVKGKGALAPAQAQFIATVPDPRTLVKYDIMKGPCIKRDTTLTLDNGMLTKAGLDKPSELLACLSIPVDVIKQIGEIPGSILSVKVSVINAEKGYNEAQSAYYTSLKTLLENQRALLEALAAKSK